MTRCDHGSSDEQRVRFHAIADLAAALAFAAAALIAHFKAGAGAYFSSASGEDGEMDFSVDLDRPLLVFLWALVAAAVVRGLGAAERWDDARARAGVSRPTLDKW